MKLKIHPTIVTCACLLAIGCQATHEQAVQETPAVPAHCEGLMVSQDEAVRMMRACEVESLGQPHEGPVILYRADGSKQCFIQPQLDWVLIVARTGCEERPIRMYIE